MAASYDYLVLRQADGTETALPSIGLKITFTDGNAVAVAADGSTATLPLGGLSVMYLSDKGTTGITSATIEAEGHATVYTIMGVKIADGGSLSTLKQSLKPGVYVVKTESGTFKTQVK